MLLFNCVPSLLVETKKISHDKHGRDVGGVCQQQESRSNLQVRSKSHEEMRHTAGSWHAESGGAIFLAALPLTYLYSKYLQKFALTDRS